MQKITSTLFAILLFAHFTHLKAQTASNICLDELKATWSSMDAQALSQSPNVTQIKYDLDYVMATDPAQKLIHSRESWLLAQNQIRHFTEDMHTYTDGSDAYFYRPQQFIVYHGAPTLKEERIIPQMDAGIWQYCLVTECFYVTEGSYSLNGTTITPKEYHLEISPEGQKKYNISSLMVRTDPVYKKLIYIDLTYQGKTLYSKATFTITDYISTTAEETPISSITDLMMESPGQLKAPFSGSKLIDIRR